MKIETKIRKRVQDLYWSISLLNTSEFRKLSRCQWLLGLPIARKGHSPASGINAIKDRDDERRIIHLQSSVQTNDLENRGDGEEEEGDDRREMEELIACVHM